MPGDVLPSPGDLPLGPRAAYHGTVAADYVLRTGLATVGSIAALQGALIGAARADARHLAFYAQAAEAGDASAVFHAPEATQVVATPGKDTGVDGGRVEILRFASPYVPLNPDLADAYLRHEGNAVARAQHWRHVSGPRPTLVVIHGFGASPAAFNVAFFGLKEIFASGWDVLLYTLPFHGSRRVSRSINGIDLLRFGMSHLSEAMLQSVHDLRIFVGHLLDQGAPRVGVTGLSLGGYVTGLAAAVDDRLDFAVPNAAVTWLPPLLDAWFPASVTTKALRLLLGGGDDETLAAALALHSPLTYEPVLPRERLMVVAGLGDRLAPPEQSLLLWEHWGRPELHWFPGSHVIHLGRGDYRAAMRRLLADA